MSRSRAGAPIVVGVDGSVDGLRALDWAADEAVLHDTSLRLVHAYEPSIRRMPTLPSYARAVVLEHADETLEAARTHALQRHGKLRVAVHAVEGPPRKVLLRQASRARMLVVGRRGSGHFLQLRLGSTSLACAMHSSRPVVVVPSSWEPAERPGGRIVLGVDGSEYGVQAIDFAFDQAVRTSSDVLAVYAWEVPNPYLLKAVELAEAMSSWQHQAETVLTEALADARGRHPDVPVAAMVEHTHPAAALVEQAVEADLLVVGGRGHGTITGMVLGSVARALLHHAECPVAVVHGQPRP